MDYETPDGSQFSLRTIRIGPDQEGSFREYTSVSALVDGVAYTGKLDQPVDQVDEGDVLNALERVPVGCINPLFEPGFTLAPTPDPAVHYLKAPSYTYDDCVPGVTFVADCLLNEIKILERLRGNPHPNIVAFHGCVVKDGRITHLCLQRHPSNLVDVVTAGLTDTQYTKLRNGIEKGLQHLHSLGLAHNDVNEWNICVDSRGEAIIIDFDSCSPFGERLFKGTDGSSDTQSPLSRKENDLEYGLPAVESFMHFEGMQ